MKDRIQAPLLAAILCLVAAGLICWFAARDFRAMHERDAIFPGPGLTEKKVLSDYFPDLTGSPADTDVFIFEGRERGGNLLILGGTHPNEPAGFMTAVLLVETIKVSKGRILIIPQANISAFTHNDPFEANPQRFSLETGGGKRWFRYGSRLTNPIHQWPDPVLFVNPSGQKLAGTECRNLNRCYPGRKNGFLTEKIAYGIMRIMDLERIDLAIDLHEAAPEYPVINALVFHENSAELAATAYMDLQLSGLEFRLEASPPNLRGLSHREWGDAAGVMALLLETANASHGRLKGRPSPSLIIDGQDKNYVKAAELGRLFVPFGEAGIPLRRRVKRHLAALQALIAAMGDLTPDRTLGFDDFLSPDEVELKGIGAFLHPPK